VYVVYISLSLSYFVLLASMLAVPLYVSLLVSLPIQSEVRRTAELGQLCAEFAEEARHWAKVIVQELHIPEAQRTVPPVTKTLGGVAGGEKVGGFFVCVCVCVCVCV
jgi:hypothetical protein